VTRAMGADMGSIKLKKRSSRTGENGGNGEPGPRGG
jgi:hypothetical protein